jgi:hypothetical protein
MVEMNHGKRRYQYKFASNEPRVATIMLCSILVTLASMPKQMSVRAQSESAFPIGERYDKVQRLAEVFVSKGLESNDAKDSEERLLRRNRGRKKGTHHRGANKRKKQSRVVKRNKRAARKKRYGGTYNTGGKPMAWGGTGSWQAPPAWGGTEAQPAWGGTEAPPAWGGGSIGRYGTCGGGSIGNGLCPNIYECCSVYGFCGTSVEYCTNKGDSEPTPTSFGKSGKTGKTGKAVTSGRPVGRPPSGAPIWRGGWVYPSYPHTIKCDKWGSSSNHWGGGYDPCTATHAPTGKCAQCDVLSCMNLLEIFPFVCFFIQSDLLTLSHKPLSLKPAI